LRTNTPSPLLISIFFVFSSIKRALRSTVPWIFWLRSQIKAPPYSLTAYSACLLFFSSSFEYMYFRDFARLLLLEDEYGWNIRTCCDEFPCVTLLAF
jgi:hypothetical protein